MDFGNITKPPILSAFYKTVSQESLHVSQESLHISQESLHFCIKLRIL